ncbi:hypothetical protein TYRP_001524 [Tyrophagus putrescentiae]|nr:hypothetical protein TYRP_001524 [Tyrophagus putrescentiae]
MNSLLRQSTDFERLRAARKEKRATFLNVPFQLECLKRLYDELNPPPPMDVNTDHGHHRSSISNSSRSVRSKLRLLKATLRRQHPNYRPPPGAMPVLLLFDRSGGRYFLFMQLPTRPARRLSHAALRQCRRRPGRLLGGDLQPGRGGDPGGGDDSGNDSAEEGGIGAQNNNTAAAESHTAESHTAESHTAENRTDPVSVEKREKEADKEKRMRRTGREIFETLQQLMAEEKLTTTPADDDDNQHHSHQLSPLQMFVKGLRSSPHNSNDQHSNENSKNNKDSNRSSSSRKTEANFQNGNDLLQLPLLQVRQLLRVVTTTKSPPPKNNNSSAGNLVCPLCEHSPFLGQADLQEHLRLLHLILR